MLSSATTTLFTAIGSSQKKSLTKPSYDSETCIKLILLGDAGTGKTSLALRFALNEFRPYLEATIGASFFEKSIILEEETDDEDLPTNQKRRHVIFKIWDTAGQEKYRALAPMYYRGAAAAIIVFDISRFSSFQLLKEWVEELKEKGPPDIVIVICGNKLDLEASGDRQVSKQDASDYATKIGAGYVETSARDDTHVTELFEQVASMVSDTPNSTSVENANENDSTTINLGATSMTTASHRSCCRS